MTATVPIAHKSPCLECGGDGQFDADGDDDDLTCRDCDGTGETLWAWSEKDIGDCDRCERLDVPVDEWGEDGEESVCLECAQSAHAQMCTCSAEGWRVEALR